MDVLPPVAGGSELVADVRDAPLSIDEVFRAVQHPSAGGICLFVGVVRDHAEGKPVARLDYEAHPSLAVPELRRVLEGVMADLPGTRVAAVHRVGELAVGDLAVVVAASAPHRAEAFAACRFAIDRLKETVPVWKKEYEPSGEAVWVNLGDPET
ncbi:MAG: molybdenum cofactor biosynthesis protein MoaE [Sandaracinus sp.]|nr:molybdenum cofactor biosynthesis protein MoaE [Sandaracinus sp.]